MTSRNNRAEWLVGLFVALSAAAMVFMVTIISDLEVGGGYYQLNARFDNVQGISKGTKVTIAGVTVGQVSDIRLDRDTLDALVTLRIRDQYDRLPLDSGVSVYTSGLLGARYLELEPGGEEEYMQEGDEFLITQSAMLLEKLISTFILNQSLGEE